ncbi:killer cell lectin-like receptor subfamily G member 1 isoform X4 [Lutra lutra]|uniref:killer cell lectin-like receptor subfamily G member 1 isoform X4 n=1 Tax=Lutra lutra TaxID=9657 RepID=UPI001FD45A50|nr:killer cell lectin-like receptor subfamily G member 1 isoform X4 [Lutra lutra]XP_047599003.1 killer cell lectin-like receptor subfamily G member 1 isoform X4 [Lutra lutra]XP_047599004.1 killer cell lectin-like receptor subfamily G member 1 isoform X4 [Lutra lutra]
MKNGNYCYYFSMEKKDWKSSLEFCLAKDSHLLEFTDRQEMEEVAMAEVEEVAACVLLKDFDGFLSHIESLVKQLLKDDFYWIGLRNEAGWRWGDGSPLNISSIISNNLIQKCGAINGNGLQASSCEVSLPWICKKRPQSVEQGPQQSSFHCRS